MKMYYILIVLILIWFIFTTRCDGFNEDKLFKYRMMPTYNLKYWK